MLSYIICHYLNNEEITIGSRNSNITLTGLGILERHAIIRRVNNQNYEVAPVEVSAKIKLNGYNLTGYAEQDTLIDRSMAIVFLLE